MMWRHEVQVYLGLCLLLGVLCTLSALRTHAAEAPRPPEGLATPDQSTSMPMFALPNVNGDTVRSEELRGKVVVIRFWASW